MKKLILVAAFFWGICNVQKVCAQHDVKDYVQQNAACVRSTSISDGVLDSIMAKIGDAIGNAPVVMLGEQAHGDAATFEIKAQLVRYLYEKKGFTVLAFESDFFGLNDGWNNLPPYKDSITNFLKQNIFAVWSQCHTTQELLANYLPKAYLSDNPLHITGFDNQLFLGHSSKYLYAKLDSVCRVLALPISKQPDYGTTILPLVSTWYKHSKDSVEYNQCVAYLQRMAYELGKALGDTSFWKKVVENLLQVNRQYATIANGVEDTAHIRDRQMADNLIWLRDVKFRGKKIIVWAANLHIAKYAGHYEQSFLNKHISMGTYFTEDSLRREQAYLIGFTSKKGSAGKVGTNAYKLNKPKPGALEYWLPSTVTHCFIDFKRYNKGVAENREPQFYMSALGHNSYKAAWNRIFDGVFYLDEMFPCGVSDGKQ